VAAEPSIRLANAPVSYGAFELTVTREPGVPDAERVLAAIAAAGYAGTELGPPGYLGDGPTLRARLAEHDLVLTGGYVPLRFGEPGEELEALEQTLDLFDAVDNAPRPVLADDCPHAAGIEWPRFLDGLARAAARARERGYEPTFHHHMGTRIESEAEIERLLEGSDVPLLLDSGHLLAAGGDPVTAVRDWRDRIDYVHIKDVSLERLRRAPDWASAWRDGVFCELGTGDVDLPGFLAGLAGYTGWLVVEQDWVPRAGEAADGQIAAQARNRTWLAEHAGI
jgi:inosose dehydratase